jgi:hypothetical protein
MTTRGRTLSLMALLITSALTLTGCPSSAGSAAGGSSGGSTPASHSAGAVAPPAGAPDAFPSTSRSRVGADPGPKQNTGGFGCDLEPHGSENFAGAVAGKVKHITAAADFSCAPNAEPIQLSQSLMLEYKGTSDLNWQLMSSDPQFYTKSPYTMIVGAPCRIGDWRLRIQADGIDAAKLPIHVDYTWPPVFVSTCP